MALARSCSRFLVRFHSPPPPPPLSHKHHQMFFYPRFSFCCCPLTQVFTNFRQLQCLHGVSIGLLTATGCTDFNIDSTLLPKMFAVDIVTITKMLCRFKHLCFILQANNILITILPRIHKYWKSKVNQTKMFGRKFKFNALICPPPYKAIGLISGLST